MNYETSWGERGKINRMKKWRGISNENIERNERIYKIFAHLFYNKIL